MKKNLTILLMACAVVFALGLCACGSSDEPAPDEESNTQAISVMEESSQEGILDAIGIDLPAPAGATDVEYFLYKLDDPIAEMRFNLDGKPMYLRAQVTGLVSFPVTVDEYINALEQDEDIANEADISGMYCIWTSGAVTTVSGRPAQAYTTEEEGGVGIILWIDVAPGILYNLGIKEGATQDLLVQTAETVFVPVQGDA